MQVADVAGVDCLLAGGVFQREASRPRAVPSSSFGVHEEVIKHVKKKVHTYHRGAHLQS